MSVPRVFYDTTTVSDVKKVREQLNKTILMYTKEVPKEVSEFFFHKSIEHLVDLEKQNFDREKVAKHIYNAYMMGMALGMASNK